MLLEMLSRWNNKRAFNAVRSDFYLNLAATLSSKAPIKDLIRQYAITAGSSPVGTMMRQWLAGMRLHPASLGEATRPYVDSSDTVVITAAERSKDPALLFKVYALNLRMRNDMASAIKKPLIIPSVAFALLGGIGWFFKNNVYAQMEMSVQLKFWPDYAMFAYNLVHAIYGTAGQISLGLLIGLITWILWAIPNYTGRFRNFLDTRVFPFTVIAQMHLMSTFCVLASLMAAGESDVRALQIIMGNSSKWLEWQMQKLKRRTSAGQTALSSLAVLPVNDLFSANLSVLSKHAEPGDLPSLIVDASMHEARMLKERMDAKAQMVTAITTIILVAGVGILMLGILGLNDATAAKIKSMSLRR